jgi:biotin transport system substrate-specific component
MQTALTQPRTLAPFESFASSIPGKIVFGLTATLVVATASHVAIPLPFTPVPLTLQPLAVLGVGLALGPVAGFLAMVGYLLEGAVGLPVFSPTGPGGLLQLFGPTGGYLLAYPFVAAISGGVLGLFREKLPRFVGALIACSVAIVALFLCGAGWLMESVHLSIRQALIAGIAPFVPGEAIKVLVASGMYGTLTRQAHK